MSSRPVDFLDLESAMPGVLVDARYAGPDNFTGKPVPGYESGKLLLTRQAIDALMKVQAELGSIGLAVKIYDAYRPQRAVNHFLKWSTQADDPEMKQRFYPAIEKSALFRLGLLVQNSSHSRGSTVDLSLVTADGAELDMGTEFDFFDVISRPDSLAVTSAQRNNRMLLRNIMLKHGFVPLEEEWWHFTLKPEPYPDSYFDFVA